MFAKAEFARNYFAAEIALADEERRDEHARRGKFGQDILDLRLLLPERLPDCAEDSTPSQFGRVLEDRRGGICVLPGAMPEHHQRGIGEFIAFHTKGLVNDLFIRKPVVPGTVLIWQQGTT